MGRGRRNDPALHVRDLEVRCSCRSPEEEVAHRQLARQLAEALETLPELDRAVVLLADEGLTGPQIAETLGLSADAVRGRLKRARRRLRERLAEAEFGGSEPP